MMTALSTFLKKYFYFCMSIFFALIVVAGFSRTVDGNLFHPPVPRPLILWVHAAAFSLWILFFILQSGLVRIRKVSTHRFLGWFGAALAAFMVPLGVTTGIVMARFDIAHYTMPDAVAAKADIQAFLAIPFYDMIAFPILVGLAILWRKKPELHRRLLFIATCCLMDAPFGRYAFLDAQDRYYIALDLLILIGMARDLVVDRHIHKVYLYSLPFIALGQALATYLRLGNPPIWQEITHAILF